jgi:hypothetical protein
VLIVRAWRDSSETTVRCRILLSDDVLTGTQRSVAASGTDEVCAVVREWLEDVASRDASVMSR